MAEKDSHKVENEQKTDDYLFMKETIKKKPLDIRYYIKRGVAAAGCGLLFGCCAAVAFALLIPVAENKFVGKEEISLSYAKPGPVGNGTVSGEEEKKTDPTGILEKESDSETAEETSKDSASEDEKTAESSYMAIYEGVYQEALEISEKPMKAMVRVSGLSDDSDLLDDSFFLYGMEEGVIFLNSGTDLYILTNYKGLESADIIRVTFCNGTAADGVLCKADPRTGLAVVRVPCSLLSEKDCEDIYVASLSDTYSLNNEKPVVAIGSPSGDFDSVIYGLITSVLGKMTVADCEYTLLGTNIIGSQESSGVLINMEGEVVGMIVQTKEDENILKAVSIAQIRPLIESLSNGEALRYFGIIGSSISQSQARNMEIPLGIYVNSVESESPAMIAGVQSGDIITELNGKEVNNMQDYMTELQKLPIGSSRKLKLCRRGAEGKLVEIEYTLTVEQK